MEAECGNTSELYNEKCGENVVSEIPITTYSGTDTVTSYGHYMTQEHSTGILTNSGLNSYTTQEYTVDTSTLSYTESYPTEAVHINNSDAIKAMIDNEIQEQVNTTEQEENIQMDVSQSTEHVENQSDESQCTIEYKIEEVQTSGQLNDDITEDKGMVVEEPVEQSEEKLDQTSTDVVTVEEIEETSLPGFETVDSLSDGNVIITEAEDSSSAHVDNAQTEEITDNIVKDKSQPDPSQYSKNSEETLQENIVKNVEDHMECSTEIAEGNLVIEEVSEQVESIHEEAPTETQINEESMETHTTEQDQPIVHAKPEEIFVNKESQQDEMVVNEALPHEEMVIHEESAQEDASLQEDSHAYEVPDVKDEEINLQNTKPQDSSISIQETENKEPEVTETLIIETITDSNQSHTDHYTIIETSDFSANTIVEEVSTDGHFAEDLNSTLNESFTEVNESFTEDDSINQDNVEEVIIIQQTDDDPDDPQEVETEKSKQSTVPEPSPSKPKPRKGRKTTYDIPMHVLGHDISKPVEPVVNGRAIPKPRLGVKVPYRNLTSQIVSKAEIEHEIMERGRLKLEQNKGDLKFARSLTQRLARKIAPPTDDAENVFNVSEEKSEVAEDKKMNVVEQSQSSIQNDSDLLAILEGDEDDPVMPVAPKEATSTSPQVDESNLKALEREIALQQLSELPHQTPKQRIFRGKFQKSTPSPTSNTLKDKPTITPPHQPNISKDKNKENTSITSPSPKKEKEYVDVSPKKQPIEIEPQVKVNMVLKTYSRKRKMSEPQDPLKDYPPPKKPVYDSNEEIDINMDTSEPPPKPPSPVYMTKSSRVIKKKVIWDPDEVPVRSPKPSPKISDIRTTPVSKNSTVVKTKTDKNSNTTEKVIEKKIVLTEKKTPEKKAEKTLGERKVVEKPQGDGKKVEKPQTEKKVEKTPLKKSISPKTSSGSKPKKIRSEIDKLLMDEGAVKMLYELNNTDETVSKKKKDFYSVERAHKDIIKKANLLKNELEQTTSSNETQISLRKKEGLAVIASVTPSPTRIGPILERKMSTNSLKSLGLTPPGSPFQHNQSSMLIRRRSSSSLSSSDDTEIEFKPRDMKRRSDTPKSKKIKKSEKDIKSERSESEDSVSMSSKTAQTISKKQNIKATVVEVKLNQYKSFTVKKTGKHVSVDLNYVDDKCYLTKEILSELISVLKRFSKDKDCNILTLTSNSNAFCLGLDYTSLVEEDEDQRKELATELSEKVKDFLFTLLNFPKVLVACIQGDCVGLGVTMLPLFDIVVASDSATFTTPYCNLGCIGEGGFLLSYPNLVGHLLASELLYAGQKMTADEAFRRGLISKLCWPEKYKETMKTLIGSITKASKQSLEGTKKQLRNHKIKDIEAAINSEKKIWIEHWISSECQEKFSELLDSK